MVCVMRPQRKAPARSDEFSGSDRIAVHAPENAPGRKIAVEDTALGAGRALNFLLGLVLCLVLGACASSRPAVRAELPTLGGAVGRAETAGRAVDAAKRGAAEVAKRGAVPGDARSAEVVARLTDAGREIDALRGELVVKEAMLGTLQPKLDRLVEDYNEVIIENAKNNKLKWQARGMWIPIFLGGVIAGALLVIVGPWLLKVARKIWMPFVFFCAVTMNWAQTELRPPDGNNYSERRTYERYETVVERMAGSEVGSGGGGAVVGRRVDVVEHYRHVWTGFSSQAHHWAVPGGCGVRGDQRGGAVGFSDDLRLAPEFPARLGIGQRGDAVARGVVSGGARGGVSGGGARVLPVTKGGGESESERSKAEAVRLLEVLRAQVGVKEEPLGSNWGPKVKVYLEAAGVTTPAPWCAAVGTWAFHEIGRSDVPGAWSPSWFPKERRVRLDDVRPGDQGGIYFPKLGRVGHLLTVERMQGREVITLEGNTNAQGSREGDQFARRIREKDQAVYARWTRN
jgi:hypothetical protein